VNIENIPAVERNKAIDQRDFCVKSDQAPGKIGPNEPEATCDQNVLVAILFH
jgi:hypothetical protein